jgi:mRNA interferase YafQ
MRTVRYTNRFKRDYKREQSGRHRKGLDTDLLAAVTLLAKDEPLPRRYFDHPLGGEWSDHRDCHIKPDLILIYRKAGRSEPGACSARFAQRTWAVKNLWWQLGASRSKCP